MSQEIHDEEKVTEGLHEDARMSQEIHDEEKVAEGLDGDERMNCMRERLVLGRDDGPCHQEHLIYRVYSSLRNENASCYEPIATSIGPYHHGKKHLLAMETLKKRYFHDLLRNRDVRFEDLLKKLEDIEDRVRGCYCYPEKIELESEAFVDMMLLDGCFIVELLLKWGIRRQHDDDLLDGPSWRLTTLHTRDLLLLENQLPFFLLQEIFQLVKPNETDPKQALVKLSLKLLRSINPIKPRNKKVIAPEVVHHLLHLWHTCLIPFAPEFVYKQPQDSKIPKSNNSALCLGMFNCCKGKPLGIFKFCRGITLGMCNCCKGRRLGMLDCCEGNCCKGKTLGTLGCCKGKTLELENCIWMPGATELKDSGIEFKASSSNLLEIKFCNGEMIIPMIYVQDDTETQLRNLIAFEQCCLTPFFCDYYFTSYASFLDFLINTSKDVEILHKKGILTHWLGEDEEVARLFNKLAKGVFVDLDESYLANTFTMVNEYRSRKIPKWRSSLVRDYFYSPWAVLSFIAAIIALSLTAIQTAYSVK